MNPLKGKRWAMVVAHPDDECLWGAGIVLQNPGDWTVICCSIPKTDPIRAWKFFDACNVLKAKPRLLPYTESSSLTHLRELDLGLFDTIVTHNQHGEYGHQHHKQLHFYVKENYGHKHQIYFGYKSGQELRLTASQAAAKLSAINCYDHVLPYQNHEMTKADALLLRYGRELLEVERYAW
jgi:LmbE family N-acetylglucosaminyl deacetylase